MPKASDFKPDQRLFALFVSRSGDGKSTSAASWGSVGRYFEMDFDLRFGGIHGAIQQKIISGENVEYQQFHPRNGWKAADELLQQWEIHRISGTFPYKTIGVGSATSLARLFVNTSHQLQKGRVLGPVDKEGLPKAGALRISGPGDFNFEVSGIHQFLDYLKAYPCNVIVTAHIIDKWGKPRNEDGTLKEETQFASNVVVGEKLALRDQVGETILSVFDNVFRFSREEVGNQLKYYVEFATDLAKNSYGIKPKRYDITNQNFYEFFQKLRNGEIK